MAIATEVGPGSARHQQASVDHTGVEVRMLHRDEMKNAAGLLATVWQSHDSHGPVDAPILIALEHAGNYVCGAYVKDRLVGVCVGFFSTPLGSALHSHITGVLPEYAGRGIGAALKHHQRAWCLNLGIEQITWTFDPLVARNAYFNIRRLRAQPIDYLVDLYGNMPDGLNDGQASDRMMVTWSTREEDSFTIPVFDAQPFVALKIGSTCEPVIAELDGLPSKVAVVVEIPMDIEQLRREDVALSRAWRAATRTVLTHLMLSGRTITDFDESGRYLLEEI